MGPSTHSELKVGIFVGLGLLVLLISIIFLGGDRILFKRYYSLKTHFAEVQGLNAGSVVALAGMKIGNVSKIAFDDEKNSLEVTVDIESDYQNRVTEGASAEIRTQGALGDRYLYINPGVLKGTPLKDGDTLATNAGTDLFGVISKNADEVGKIFDIINEIHLLLKNINGNGKSEKIMDNLLLSSQQLSKTIASTSSILADFKDNKLKSSIAHLSNVLEKLDKGQGTLGALINDPTIHDRLKAMVGGSSQSNYIKSMIKETIQRKPSTKGP